AWNFRSKKFKRIFMQNLRKAPENTKDGFYPKSYFHNAAFNIIALICWGKRIESFENPFYKEINDVKGDKEKRPCAIRDMLNKVNEVSSSLTWLTAVLADHLEVQAKAHQELDQVIGRSCLLKVSDGPNIPYICAIIKEGQRYCAPVFLAAPHYDDEYNGYHIPSNKFKESGASLTNGNYENRVLVLEEDFALEFIRTFIWESRIFRIENAPPLGEDGKPIPIGLNIERFAITIWPKSF
ncbi:6475_t:CDS:2, partial [Dentiscutata erythropus]